ncbi:hypothetical protein EV189_2551 [Motilibacter rhizosphaerae]|uniref:DsbA family dithiol-disulfide isomerase n=1 Tax=Motilibacter rhizosphaerae TaxID=598652 RepID=A0A4Q7NPY3_9ACTN|nr:hypothetical protein [Motilibacter rhizosphaerae]RZS87128.1 hypothetical protein EV189_2551 [Motilibacter rhizosphaerae]
MTGLHEAAAPRPGTLQVWSDPSCPAATRGLAAMRRTREELGLETVVAVELRAFPLVWAHGASTDDVPVEHAAVRAAQLPGIGSLAASEELDRRLRDAGGGDPLALAEDVDGLDAAALRERLGEGEQLVREDWALVPELGVEGSPYVRLADGTTAYDPADGDWDRLLRAALAPEG